MSLPPNPPSDVLLRSLRRLLRPLVRLLIRSGIPCPVFTELARGVYVDVAVNDLLKDQAARTDSRISLLTGIHRKEIRRLRTSETPADEVPAVVTLSSQIIARWIGTPAYTDAGGQPALLPRAAGSGDGPSFEALVESVTKDVRPRAVLDDLLGQEIVALDAEDRVRLNVAAFIPRQGRDELLFYFGRNLHDHIAAAASNVLGDRAGAFFDRSLHYDGLTPDQAARLEEAGREAGQRLLVALNRMALDMLENEGAAGEAPPPGAASRRVNLGVYLFADDDHPGGSK